MKQERHKILDMVEEGKISAEEAVRLLEAIGSTRRQFDWDSDDMDAKLQKISGAAKDFGDKMGSAFKDMEPKLRDGTRKVVEKSVEIVDELSKSLNQYLKNLENEDKKDCCSGDDECCSDDDDAPKPN